MKKIVIVVLMALLVASLCFAGPEEVDVYAYLYNAALTNSAQRDILNQMVQAKLTGAGEFYAKSLRRLVSEYKNIKNVTERDAADEQAMLLSALLGAEKYAQSAPDLWLVVEAFNAPLVKAEAMMALGKIRAVNYLPQVIRVLESVNAAPTADRLNGERIAFGAIIALEKYGNPDGYLPVFFASTGWYSKRIQDQAKKSLPFIAQDPTPYMMQVVQGAGYNYPTKYLALQTITASGAPNDSKASVAVAAIAEGWKANPSDTQLKTTLASMRKLAMQIIYNYGTTDSSVYPSLENSYTRGYDTEEKLYAISTLAKLASDESVDILSKFLMDLNSKRQSGNIRQEDEQMVRSIIDALGNAGKPKGKGALNAAVGLDWTPAVKTRAQEAIKKIDSSN